jgi:pimeloyl-ACP methyl ester carboxylesterase
MNLSRELHTLIPDSEWATSIGGHAFLWEHPGPFNQAVLGFIGKNSRSVK